jgi:hypothetical protein
LEKATRDIDEHEHGQGAVYSLSDDLAHSHDSHARSHDSHAHSHDSHAHSYDSHAHSHDSHAHSHDSHAHSHDSHDTEPAIGDEHSREHNSRQTIVSMDALGIFASTLCLIHCLAMPLVVAFLPVLGLQFLEGHGAHLALAGFVVAFGLLAILPGYMKHRKPAVLLGLLVGLTLVLSATFGYLFGLSEASELPLITVGNLILVVSHLFNRQLCKCSH